MTEGNLQSKSLKERRKNKKKEKTPHQSYSWTEEKHQSNSLTKETAPKARALTRQRILYFALKRTELLTTAALKKACEKTLKRINVKRKEPCDVLMERDH